MKRLICRVEKAIRGFDANQGCFEYKVWDGVAFWIAVLILLGAFFAVPAREAKFVNEMIAFRMMLILVLSLIVCEVVMLRRVISRMEKKLRDLEQNKLKED